MHTDYFKKVQKGSRRFKKDQEDPKRIKNIQAKKIYFKAAIISNSFLGNDYFVSEWF